ncbi:MAG: hypothetical protein JXB47_03035 [Anaerolineae bacterium]|nr:hypothetical protein [Anaerolineae bacterium]
MENSSRLEPPAEPVHPTRPMHTYVPGILFIAVGVWAFLNYQNQSPWVAIILLLGAFGVSMLARALLNRRVEAGLLFLGSFVTLSAAAVAGSALFLGVEPVTLWPLVLVALGLALLLTALLARVRGLTPVALVSALAGVIALPYTLGMIPPEMVGVVENGWPAFFAAIGLLTLIAAFGHRRAPKPAGELPEDTAESPARAEEAANVEAGEDAAPESAVPSESEAENSEG